MLTVLHVANRCIFFLYFFLSLFCSSKLIVDRGIADIKVRDSKVEPQANKGKDSGEKVSLVQDFVIPFICSRTSTFETGEEQLAPTPSSSSIRHVAAN